MSLDRSSELRADPETTADWQRRSRDKARARDRRRQDVKPDALGLRDWGRAALKRRATPGRVREGEDREAADVWTLEVLHRDGGVCCVTGKRATSGHHVIPKRQLRSDNRPDLVWDPDAGAAISHAAHMAHEFGPRQIRRSELPRRCIAWAQRHGYGWYLDRHYPDDGAESDGIGQDDGGLHG